MKNPFIWALVLGIVTLHVYREIAPRLRRMPPPLGVLGSFVLTDQQGLRFDSDKLKGKIVVLGLSESLPQLKAIAHDLKRYKSFTQLVVIGEHSGSSDVDLSHFDWLFLNGSAAYIDALVLAWQKNLGNKMTFYNRSGNIAATGCKLGILLVDRSGFVRGIFSQSSSDLAQLVSGAMYLASVDGRGN